MIAHAIDSSKLNLGRIGGSDIAAILGLSDYSTAFDVWLRIVEGVCSPPSRKMKAGKRFERVVGSWWAEERGVEIQWFEASIEHPDRPWQRLTPDVRVLGYAVIADVKRSMHYGERHGTPGTDQIADYEFLQLQCYLEGLSSIGDEVNTAFLVLHDTMNDELVEYQCARDPELGAMIVDAGAKFWRDHVVTKIPPPIGWSKNAAEYLAQRHPSTDQPVRAATPTEHSLLMRMRDLKADEKRSEKEIDAIKNELRALIGDARGLDGDWGSIIRANVAGSTFTVTKQPYQSLTARFKKEKT